METRTLALVFFFKKPFKVKALPAVVAQVWLIATPELQIEQKFWADAKPREILIAACLIVPIIGIGLYPKLATQTYDAKTVAVTSKMRNAFSIVAQENPNLYSNGFNVPQISAVKPQTLLGTVK